MPTDEDYLQSLIPRLQTHVQTIHPCGNCTQYQDKRCQLLRMAILSPQTSTCPGYESAGRDPSLLVFEQLVTGAEESDRLILEQLIGRLRDEYPDGCHHLARAIARFGTTGRQVHGGLGDK